MQIKLIYIINIFLLAKYSVLKSIGIIAFGKDCDTELIAQQNSPRSIEKYNKFTNYESKLSLNSKMLFKITSDPFLILMFSVNSSGQ